MKKIRFLIISVTIAGIICSCTQSSSPIENAGDDLDQWNDTQAKASIQKFVETVTDETNPFFLPVEDRVAVFDMDGTILLEKPNYVLFDFAIRKMMEQIDSNPALKQKQPYKAIYEQDRAYFNSTDMFDDAGLYSVLLYATDGYTNNQYREAILEYFKTVKDKRYNKPYNQLVYSPIVQLIQYLKKHQFDIYIVSGSDPQFTRIFCEDAAKIPVKNVIGTTILTKWIETDTMSYFVREHKFVMPINDEAGKPVNILNKIGKVPVLAVGNSTGDYHMLEYSKNAPYSLQMIVNHDDSVREYNYHADNMKILCQEKGWQEISMKNDFKVIFND